MDQKIYCLSVDDTKSAAGERDEATTTPIRSILKKVIGRFACAAVIAAIGFPFAKDAYQRHTVAHQLALIMNEHDRVAFAAWQGDALSFRQSLQTRCELNNGLGAPACDQYASGHK